MRILALTNLYPNPQQPHRAAYNRQYFRALAAAGHPTHVIAPVAWTDEWTARRAGKPPLPADRRLTADGTITVDHPRYLFIPRMLRGWYGWFFQRSVRGAFARAVTDFRPDVILASWAYPDGLAAVNLGHDADLPVVVNVVGSDIVYAAGVRRRRTASALRRADGVWAVSQDLARLSTEMGAQDDHVRVIYNGVDTRLFRPGCRSAARRRVGIPPDERAILFVGNLVDVKGIDVLMAALGQLARQPLPFACRLIGQGPLRPHLERHAASLGIGDRVRFAGAVPHDELPDWFRSADVLVLPSRSEGVPNVLLEASACGTPYVASRVGGIPEIARWGRSVLVPAEDPAALAAGIERALAGRFDAPGPTATFDRSFDVAAGEVASFLAECAARYHAGHPAAPPRLAPHLDR